MLVAVTFTTTYSYAQWLNQSGTGNYYLNSGNVGIGTATPTQALWVVGTIVGTHISAQGNLSVASDVDARIYLSNTTATTGQNWNLISETNGSFETGIYGAAPFQTITSTGNVGIGTTTPANKFVVENNGNSNNYHMAGFYNNSTAPGAVAGIEIMAGNAGVGGGGLLFYKGNGQSSDPNGFFIDNSQNAPLGLMTNNTERMRISSSGNVGIGTTTPDQKLTVNGTIHAKQINVDLNVPGPDYVFKKGYKLKTLPEINRYIILNKHLPEIPSAKSMEQNGINVSELNMKLLQKVEELTLYLIEKDKQDKQKDTQLQIQQEQINQLKEQMTIITKALNQQVKKPGGKTNR